jgi:large subunit ribosomal protein L1
VHFVVGKASFTAEQLDENIGAALEEIVRLKPSSAKGRYIQKGAVSTTFGPGIPLDVNAI